MSSMGRRSSRPKEDVFTAPPSSSPESVRGQYYTSPTTPGKIATAFAGTGSLNTPSSATAYSTPPSSIRPSSSGRSQLAPMTPSSISTSKMIEIVANPGTPPYTPTPAANISSKNPGISRPPITAYTFTPSASAPPIPPIPEEHTLLSSKSISPVGPESFATTPIIQLVRKSSLSSSSITPSFATAQEEPGLRSRCSGSASSDVPSPLPSPQPQLLFKKEAETVRINGTPPSSTSYVVPPPFEGAAKRVSSPNSALSALSNANYVHPSPSYIKRETAPPHSNAISTTAATSIIGGIGLVGGVVVGRGLTRSSSARVKVPAAFPLSSPTSSTTPITEDIREGEVKTPQFSILPPSLVESEVVTEVPEPILEVAPLHTEQPELTSKDVILTGDLPEDDKPINKDIAQDPSTEEETTPLLELRKQMTSAKSVGECLALLDSHIAAQVSVIPTTTEKNEVLVGSDAHENLLAEKRHEEEALMAEFFLCGDLPRYSPVRVEDTVEGEEAAAEGHVPEGDEEEQEEASRVPVPQGKEAITSPTTFADVQYVHQSLATPDPEEQTWPSTPTSP